MNEETFKDKLTRYFKGTATAEEAKALIALLNSDPGLRNCREKYIGIIRTHVFVIESLEQYPQDSKQRPTPPTTIEELLRREKQEGKIAAGDSDALPPPPEPDEEGDTE